MKKYNVILFSRESRWRAVPARTEMAIGANDDDDDEKEELGGREYLMK